MALLFVIHFDDIVDVFEKAECSSFADDLKIVHVINGMSDELVLHLNLFTNIGPCPKVGK